MKPMPRMMPTRYPAPHALRQRDMSLTGLVAQIKANATMRGGLDGPANSYSEVATVYACVRAKADAFGSLPLMISTAGDQIIESGPLVDLAERPNPQMTGRTFRRYTAAYMDLFGRCHWWFMLDAGGRPVGIVPINPLLMKPQLDRNTGELIGWKYRISGARGVIEETLPLEEVHTIIDPDFESPNDPLAGLSPRRAVAHAISQYWKSDLANEASLDNGVEPGGVIQTVGGSNISNESRNVLREELQERHAGVLNRRRLLILEGLEYKPIPVSFSDMEFVELKKMSRVDICAAFNVPPAVIGYYEDANYGFASSAEEAFWIRTILPMAARIAEEFNLAVLDRFNGDRSLRMADARTRLLDETQIASHGYRRASKAAGRSARKFYAWFDSSEIPAVQRARLAGVDQAMKWNGMGVPLADIIEATDAPFPVRDWQRTWYKPFGLADVAEDNSPGITEPEGGPGPLPSDTPGSPGNGAGVDRGVGVPEVRGNDEALRARLWLAWRASWQTVERGMRNKIRRHFNGLREQVLANLAKTTLPGAVEKGLKPDQKRDIIGTILFDLVKANGQLQALAGPVLREGYRLGGEQSMQEAADAAGKPPEQTDPFNIKDPEIERLMRQREIRLTDVNKTVRHRLAGKIADGIEQGQTQSQIADAIREEFNFAGKRAATIARTEIGGAVEESRNIAREQAGVPLKSWLSSRKEHARSLHRETEVVTMAHPLAVGEDFTIAGTSITCPYPRATGLPEHDINCGCTTVSRYPGESVKQFMDRFARKGFLTYEQLSAKDRRTDRGTESDDEAK